MFFNIFILTFCEESLYRQSLQEGLEITLEGVNSGNWRSGEFKGFLISWPFSKLLTV